MALRYRARFAVATAANLGATVFNLAVPWLLGTGIDQALAILRHPGGAGSFRGRAITSLLVLGGSVLQSDRHLRGGASVA